MGKTDKNVVPELNFYGNADAIMVSFLNKNVMKQYIMPVLHFDILCRLVFITIEKKRKPFTCGRFV